MNKFKKFLRSIICVTMIVVGGWAFADTQVVTFLNTYDQLAGMSGQPGFFLVRDAGNKSTGQHGDPRVRWGWAMYTWDVSIRGFKMVSKQETTEASFPDIVNFLTKEQYNADIGPFKNSVLTNAAEMARIRAENVLINGRIDAVEEGFESIHTDISNLNNRVTSTEAGIARIDVDIDALKEDSERAFAGIAKNAANITVLSNNINTVDGKLDVAVAELKAYTDLVVSDTKIDIITNTAKRVRAVLTQAKAYTDSQIAIEANRADTNTQAKVDAKATEILGTMNTKLGDLDGSESVTIFVNTKTQGAIGTSKSYTDTEVGKVYVVATNAQTLAKTNSLDIAKHKIDVSEQFVNERQTTTGAISTAKEEAISTAEADASTKSENAKNAAIAFTTNKLDAADLAQLNAGTTKLATKQNIEDVVLGKLVFPLQIKKGDITYTLDVVDDGSGDITLKITK